MSEVNFSNSNSNVNSVGASTYNQESTLAQTKQPAIKLFEQVDEKAEAETMGVIAANPEAETMGVIASNPEAETMGVIAANPEAETMGVIASSQSKGLCLMA